MKTITQLVRDELNNDPLLGLLFSSKVMNGRAMARRLRPLVEAQYGEKVGLDTIAVALSRIKSSKAVAPDLFSRPKGMYIAGTHNNLEAFNFPRGTTGSETIPDSVRYYVQTTGSSEHTVIISHEDAHLLSKAKALRSLSNLTAISIRLPDDSYSQEALFAKIFLVIAQTSISIVEVVSTFNELTILINSADYTKLHITLSNYLGN